MQPVWRLPSRTLILIDLTVTFCFSCQLTMVLDSNLFPPISTTSSDPGPPHQTCRKPFRTSFVHAGIGRTRCQTGLQILASRQLPGAATTCLPGRGWIWHPVIPGDPSAVGESTQETIQKMNKNETNTCFLMEKTTKAPFWCGSNTPYATLPELEPLKAILLRRIP